MVVDEVNTSLTDRELLILLNERLANLSVKLDEYRLDNMNKYESLKDELNCMCERLQTQINTISADVEKMKNMSSMQKGAYMTIGGLISIIGAAGAFFVYID